MVALGGCAGLHLYDAEREKVAQGAKKSLETANVSAVIAVARQNHAALTETEMAQARRVVELRRDLLLQAIATDASCLPPRPAAPVDGPSPPPGPVAPATTFAERYRGCIDHELGRLISPVPADARPVRAALFRNVEELKSGAAAMADERTKSALIFNGVTLPACTAAAPLPPAPPNDLEAAVRKAAPGSVGQLGVHYGQYRRTCERYLQKFGAMLAVGTGSEFGAAVGDFQQAVKALTDARNASAVATHVYNDALTAYTGAAKALEAKDSEEARKRVEEALDGVRAAAEALGKAGGMLGQRELSADRVESADAIVAALKGDALDPKKYGEETRRAVGVLASLPRFADGAIDLVRRRKAPLLGALLLEKELHAARQAAAARQVVRAEERVSLQLQRVLAYVDRTLALLDARRGLAEAVAAGALPDTAGPALGSGSAAQRIPLLLSLTAFMDSFSLAGTAIAEAEQQLIALEYAVALDRSEDAVKEWEAVITVPIDRLVAFYGSGLKSEAVAAALAQALGLGLIGAGTLK